MAPKEDMQLEAHIDHALRRHTFHPLEGFLQKETSSQKCSKELLLKLDKLICRELEKKEVKNVSLVLNVIYKCANCMTSNGEEWLTASVKQGLVEKITWFEKIRVILTCVGNVKNGALLTLTEDYFDVVMVVHDLNNDGKIQVLEHFISRTCSLVSDTAINTFIKQEAVRKLNLMLDTIPQETRKKLIFTKEMVSTMSSMGKIILDAGDYDLQVAITEALCRMTSEAQRGELASQWFPMEFVTDAFKGIKDSDFETDCRKFLNLVNGMLGDKRRVFTYPCLSAHLGNHKLHIPSDEKLEEFWIDFNVGTQSISFYVSTDDNGEDHQWETVCMPESEVDMYNIEATGSEILLTVNLNTPVTVGQKKGSLIRIFFDSALDVSDVTRKVFGTNKFKGFIKKQSVSVAKTAVHIVFDESGSQILIPESQVSISSAKNVTVINTDDVITKNQPSLSTPNHNQQINQEDSAHSRTRLVTPSRSKVSEASINITGAGGFKVAKPSLSTPSLGKGRIKPPLEMINNAERKTTVSVQNKKDHTSRTKQTHLQKNKPTTADTGNVESEEIVGSFSKEDDQTQIVPDTQFIDGENSSLPFDTNETVETSQLILPCLTERYLGLNKKYSTSTHPNEKTSVSNDFIYNKEKIVSDNIIKQQAFHAAIEGEKCAQNTKTVTSNQKTKVQPQETKTANQENSIRTEAKEKILDRQKYRNSFSKTETSLTISVQNSEIHVHTDVTAKKPKPDSGRKETANSAKSKNSRDVAKRKEAEKDMNEKARGLQDAAQSLISKIGSKYSIEASMRKQEEAPLRQNLNKYSMQTKKGKRQNRSFKTKGKNESSMVRGREPSDDIYSFHSVECDDPTIELGVSSIVLSKTMTSIAVIQAEKSSEKKHMGNIVNEQKLKKARKHLFSDTDTDRGGDDSKTDISWLQDPTSKKKPKIFSYSRQRQGKQPEETLPCKAAEIPKPSRKPKAKPCKELCEVNADKEDANNITKQSKMRRPQRATVKRKNYRESSNSESESEEEPTAPSRKDTPKHQYGLLTIRKPLSVEKPKKPENPMSRKNQKNPPKTEVKTVTSKIAKTLYMKPAESPVCSSPQSIEKIRSEQYESETELPSRHQSIAASSPSLSASPPQLTPKKSLNISAAMLKNITKQWAPSSDRSTHRTATEHGVYENGQESFSPAPSHVSLATLTLDHSTVSGINILEMPEHEYNEPHFSTSSPATRKTEIQAHANNKDNSCTSFRSGSSVRRTSSCEMTRVNIYESGPTIDDTMSYLKRVNNGRSNHADISTEGSNNEVKRKKIKLLPRRLFSSTDKEEPGVSESLSTVSGNDVSIVGVDTWDGNDSNVGMMCQKISKEFTRKIQNRSRKMDYFTKQSLKSAQKHLTSMDVQVRECRIMHLEKFQQTVLEEIENFEKDSQALKQMEKDFANFCSQQTQVLSFYHKSEHKRIHCLKASFEKNVSHSTDYEEKVFNSEMHIMKENMKAVQERLLKEMQEEELLSVRRGLQSLFMTGAGPF